MATPKISSELRISDRLQNLAQLFEQGQASELMERTVEKLLVQEAEESARQYAQIKADMAEFEARYGMNSEDFYRRYQAGETDDRMDFVEWASLVQMAENLRQRLEALTGRPVT